MDKENIATFPDLDGLFETKIIDARRQRQGRAFLIKTAFTMLVVFLLLTQVLGIVVVRGESMVPMVNDGDIMLIWRLDRRYNSGDIVLFNSTLSATSLIKRIIAAENETIEITENGFVVVDDILLDEPYLIIPGITAPGTLQYPLTVEDGRYFVLGDNRTAALDSRDPSVGTVSKKDIIGKMVFLFRLGGK